MIHGYRTVFDMGGLVSPLAQADGAHSKRLGDAQGGTTPVSAAHETGGQGNLLTPEKTVNDPQKTQYLGSGTEAPHDRRRGSGQGDEARQPHDALRQPQQPTLPQLSAEALATALMTAEPDKALVPRVLPADPTGAE